MAADSSSPFLRWKEASGLTWEQLAALVGVKGGKVKPRTLDHIARGRRRPSYELAVVLSSITGIPVPKWMECRVVGTAAPASTPITDDAA